MKFCIHIDTVATDNLRNSLKLPQAQSNSRREHRQTKGECRSGLDFVVASNDKKSLKRVTELSLRQLTFTNATLPLFWAHNEHCPAKASASATKTLWIVNKRAGAHKTDGDGHRRSQQRHQSRTDTGARAWIKLNYLTSIL